MKQFYSIFGQIEAVIAEAMIKEGKAIKILQEDISETVLYLDGRKAKFGIIIDKELEDEFDRRVKLLAA